MSYNKGSTAEAETGDYAKGRVGFHFGGSASILRHPMLPLLLPFVKSDGPRCKFAPARRPLAVLLLTGTYTTWIPFVCVEEELPLVQS